MPLWWIKHYKVLSRVPFQWPKRGEVPSSDDFLCASTPHPIQLVQTAFDFFAPVPQTYSVNNDNTLYFAAQFIIKSSTEGQRRGLTSCRKLFYLSLYRVLPSPSCATTLGFCWVFPSNNTTAQPRLTFKTIKGMLTSTSFEEQETWLVSKGIY